jgi:hypothetical protein
MDKKLLCVVLEILSMRILLEQCVVVSITGSKFLSSPPSREGSDRKLKGQSV